MFVVTTSVVAQSVMASAMILGSISRRQRDLTPQPPSLGGKGEQDL